MESRKTVAVFGAGVAGLTAAHELVVRGFDVTVYDLAINHVIGHRTLDRGIGGMARSQFVVDDEQCCKEGEIAQLRPATDFLRDATLEFAIDCEGHASLREARPNDLLAKFKKLVKELVSRDQLCKLYMFLPVEQPPRDPLEDPRLRFLANVVEEANITTAKTLATECANFPVMDAPRRDIVFFDTGFPLLPAEHGFRFFPSFYRHVFDTMGRTPLTHPRAQEVGRRSVYENLVPVDGLGFARGSEAVSFLLPRHPPQSLEQFWANLRNFVGELEWSGEDLDRFGLKLFEYATSCSKRREAEYEKMSWCDFVELRSYSPIMREHLEFGPQMMASLRGSQSDARTQGTIITQLLLDQQREGTRPDCTLAGPTSGYWFDHWHDYLELQGVKFVRGKLEDFTLIDARPFPVLDGQREPVVTDYVVLALSLEAMAEVATKLKRSLGDGLDNARDLDAVLALLGDEHRVGQPDGPMRHMSGIQFYFDTEVKFWRGHTQYLDSEWGLTSIAQTQFWSRPRNANDPYRSIVSVDIGIWDRETKPRPNANHGDATPLSLRAQPEPAIAGKCDAKRLAKEVWAQIEEHHDEAFSATYGADAQLAYPRAFALDAGLELDEHGVVRNDYLFLVNRVGEFARRPGRLASDAPAASASYELIDGRYVLAGTYMKTYTRITSMESANESARHAVNAILKHSSSACDRCDIWDPEEHELPAFQWLKDLDRDLFDRGLPHFVKVLGWSALPTLVHPALEQGLRARGLVIR